MAGKLRTYSATVRITDSGVTQSDRLRASAGKGNTCSLMDEMQAVFFDNSVAQSGEASYNKARKFGGPVELTGVPKLKMSDAINEFYIVIIVNKNNNVFIK